MTKDPPFQIPKLSQLVDLLIGDAHCVVIPSKYYDLATLIELKAEGTTICKVQWEDEYGQKLLSPILWQYARWIESSEKWARAKKRSHDERVARFLFEDNTRALAKKIAVEFMMDDKWSTSTAISALTKGRTWLVKYLKVTLKTKEEEL